MLDTVTVNVDQSKAGKMKFLIDTGAEVSIIKGDSLRTGVASEPTKGINIKGISNSLMKTEGTVTLRLLTETHSHCRPDTWNKYKNL
jgi:hypothetical protein